jgi:hypothetical protein
MPMRTYVRMYAVYDPAEPHIARAIGTLPQMADALLANPGLSLEIHAHGGGFNRALTEAERHELRTLVAHGSSS